MRTTVRINDDLMRDLKKRARQEGVALTTLINRLLREGMDIPRQSGKPSGQYREETFPMGRPKVDLTKALSLAASQEDSEALQRR